VTRSGPVFVAMLSLFCLFLSFFLLGDTRLYVFLAVFFARCLIGPFELSFLSFPVSPRILNERCLLPQPLISRANAHPFYHLRSVLFSFLPTRFSLWLAPSREQNRALLSLSPPPGFKCYRCFAALPLPPLLPTLPFPDRFQTSFLLRELVS